MPVERGPQIVRRGVLRLVQGDRVDAGDRMMSVGGVVDSPNPRQNATCACGIQAEPRKHQHAVVFERLEDRGTQRFVACQPVEVSTETSAPRESVSLLIVSRLMKSAQHQCADR